MLTRHPSNFSSFTTGARRLRVPLQVPSMIAGRRIRGIRHQRALRRAKLPGEVDVLDERISLDIELRTGILLKELSDLAHIVRPDMALVGARMDGDSIRPGVEAQPGGVNDAGDADGPRVAQGRDFVDVNA